MNKVFLPCFFCLLACACYAQTGIWTEADDRLFIESKWRYTYTLHAESNTIIHKAGGEYDFFLYFRYDYSYLEYLNGKLTRGNWHLDGRQLSYTFQQASQFKISTLNKSVLVLEFTQPHSKGNFQYHFVRVETKDAPFAKPGNELPEVLIEAENPNSPGSDKPNWWAFGKKKSKKKQPAEPAPTPTYINIELAGGGYYGGIDPVLKDFIHIKSDGRLIKEYQSIQNGLIVNKKNISREELEQFCEYLKKQGFFEMQRVYDCTDPACHQRKSMKPAPIPLRLSITHGSQKKVITIAIWGKDELGVKYVEYPPALDNIIDAIQRMASRLEEQVVRK